MKERWGKKGKKKNAAPLWERGGDGGAGGGDMKRESGRMNFIQENVASINIPSSKYSSAARKNMMHTHAHTGLLVSFKAIGKKKSSRNNNELRHRLELMRDSP